MASYQSRGRDPLLDSTTQAAIEKRGRELFGVLLIVVGVLMVIMLGSYTAEDPSWISATDASVQNWLGSFGASAAAPMIMVVGVGIWALPAILLAWGLRFASHYGEERAAGRLIFAPIAIAMAAIYAVTLSPSADWPPNFGMGGMFGDTVLAVVLTMLPFGAGLAVKLFSLVTFVVLFGLMACVLGFTRAELRVGGRWLLLGVIMTYATILRILGKTATVSAKAAQGGMATLAVRRENSRMSREALAQSAAEEDEARRLIPQPELKARAAAVVRANPAMPTKLAPMADLSGRKMPPMTAPNFSAAPIAASAPVQQSGGFLSGLLKRNDPMPEPELVAQREVADAAPVDGARVKARITDAIRNRKAPEAPVIIGGMRVEPKLTAGKGPQPLLLDVRNTEDAVFDDAELTDVEEQNIFAAPTAILHRALASAAENSVTEPAPVARVVVPTPEPKKVVQHALQRSAIPSKQALQEMQPGLQFEDKYANYEMPPLSLLASPSVIERHHLPDEALEQNARMLESVLDDYGVKGEIVSVRPGPVVTMYELEPAPGLKASRVIGLADDIARSMSAQIGRASCRERV